MLPAINVGPLVFPTAGLVYIIGAWVSLSIVERAARRLQLDAESLYNMATIMLLSGVIMARLTFVALFWPVFAGNLLSILWPLTAGFNVWGGLAGGLAGGFFYARYRQFQPGPTLDALTPGLLGLLFVVSVADFLAGTGYGTMTNLPWGISFFGVRRHAVQVYEMVVAVAALALWWRLSAERRFDGQLTLATVALYGSGRLFVDAFRANAWISDTGLHILQVICLMAVLASLFLLGHNSQKIAETS